MRTPGLLALFVVGLVLLPCAFVRAGDTAPPNEVKRAEHYLEKLEKQVALYRGKPFTLSYDSKEALRRVRALHEAYPDDPQVQAMFERVRQAVRASKGDTIEITPAMLAYRENEQRLARLLGEINVAAWQDLVSSLRLRGEVIEEPFPTPEPLKTDPDDLVGRYVILEELAYPANEFTDTGGQYVFVGSQRRGLYYVELSNRAWLGAYEALKRFRREVSSDVPEPWTLLGRIVGVSLLVPQAGEEKTMAAWFGWRVEPVALYAPGKVLARADPQHPEGGTFAGEDRLEEIKASTYTFTAVPDDVEPLALVEIFATAIKEKNWRLFLECIDPARRKTPKAISRLRYFYDNNQERYHRWYVYVEPLQADPVLVIRGWRSSGVSDEDFFLSEEDKKKIAEHAEPLVEQVRVTIRTFDERGRQFSLPSPVVLRRYEGKRWYVYSGYPL